MKHILTLLAALLLAPLAEAEPFNPNIIFVLFDDMDWGQPHSCKAKFALRTTNFNRLAAQRMRLTNVNTATAVYTRRTLRKRQSR